MSDLPSALGIEAVELVSEGGRSVTVRVTGRWRRRRPELRGQAMLVVETGTVRQRFVAMPEPPSLIGAAPGTWRLSFTVPAELAPQLAGKTFLQLGSMMVPLPVGEAVEAVAGEGSRPEPIEPPDPDLIEARELRNSELAAESARRRAAEAEAALVELHAHVRRIEDELARARADADRLQDEIAESERRLRSSEQHVHAERARRLEVEQALADKTRSAGHDLRVLHDHVADLERELGRLRRAVDEAQHLAAAAEARRADAERRLDQRPPDPPPRVDARRAARIASEFGLARASAQAAAAPVPRHRPAAAGDREALRLEGAMVSGRAGSLAGELAATREELAETREELAGTRDELAEARRDLADVRRDLDRQRLLTERAYAAIDQVRGELAVLGGDLVAPPPAPPPSPPAAPTPAEPVQADKLSAALARLREATPLTYEAAAPADAPAMPSRATAAPVRPAKPWMGKGFRALAARDAVSAGRLLLALLPAQRAADPRPVVYDLVLGDLATARVAVSSAGAQVELGDAPRPLSEVDFQLVGDLASMARLLVAGPVRRRYGWLAPRNPVARIRGDRARFSALEHLIDAPLTLGQLRAAGVRFDPVLAMTVAALMIEPDWTAGERFTIGHRVPDAAAPDAYLHVRDGNVPLPSAEPPHGPLASVMVCPADEVIEALTGTTPMELEGEERPLAQVRRWLERAQSG